MAPNDPPRWDSDGDAAWSDNVQQDLATSQPTPNVEPKERNSTAEVRPFPTKARPTNVEPED